MSGEEGSTQPDDAEPQEAEIMLNPAHMAGVWANWAQVSHSPHEFTIDFVRMEYSASPPRGIVVARVSVSPLFVTQLIDALTDNWRKFAAKALPREVADHDPGTDED